MWFPLFVPLCLCADLWPTWRSQPLRVLKARRLTHVYNVVFLKCVIKRSARSYISCSSRCSVRLWLSGRYLRWRSCSPDDTNCVSLKMYLFVFITALVFNPVLDVLTCLLNQRHRWSMNKVPLTDLQAMSIKLELHVLSVILSHAVSTPHWCHITYKVVHSRINISHICVSTKLQAGLTF